MISEKLPQEIISLPQAGIWALVNEKDGKIFLSFSNAMAVSLTRNLMAIKEGSHRYKTLVSDAPKLSLKIVEEFSKSNVENRLRLNYWMDHFREQGYTLYNDHVSIKMRVKKDLLQRPLGVVVYLVNSRYKKIPVGFFQNMDEADRFIETFYRNGIYEIIRDQGPMSQDLFKRIEDENVFLD